MNSPRNPFILGPRIERPYFCDRQTEQKQLTSAIVNGRNVLMISPRRMGKTALIDLTLRESEEIEKNYITFFFDILQTSSLSEFAYLLGRTIFDKLRGRSQGRLRDFIAALKSLQGSFGFDPASGLPTFNIQLGDIHYPEYTIEEIFSFIEQSDRQIIIAIDEFQQITNYPEKNTEALLRSQVQKMTKATFIFAGSEQSILNQMFTSSKRPFYNSSEILHLNPIDKEVYIEFAQEMFRRYGRSVVEEPLRRIYDIFDGNTFYLQRTLNGAFAETASGDECTPDIIMSAVRAMMASNEVLYRQMLSSVTSSQKELLSAISQERIVTNPMSSAFVKSHALTSASSVQSALLRLQKNGYVTKTETGYSLTDPLLRIFINSIYSTPEI